MLHLVHAPLPPSPTLLPVVAVYVDRRTLARRIWRGAAADETEFGFDLEKPLQPGDVVLRSAHACYVIEQTPEALLEISLEMPPSAAAGVGWAIGNLHLELMSEPSRLLTPDETAVRRLLERIDVPYRTTTAVFRPGRFARGAASAENKIHELGASHKH